MKFMDFIDAVNNNGVMLTKNTATIEVTFPMATKTHIVEVSPLSAKCDTLRYNEDAEYEAIKWAIDFDKWQHSWHNEVKPENYEHFLEIIQGKVIEKSEQLIKLNSVAIFLENKIRGLNTRNISTVADSDISDDCEPF